MTHTADLTSPVGAPLPPPRNARLVEGRGRFTADLPLPPGTLHAAFLRSPYPHARLTGLDTSAALALPGVAAVLTGRKIAALVGRYCGDHAVAPDLVAPDQSPMVTDVARWEGEPVALALATTRAVAEDACAAIVADWQVLPAVSSPLAALEAAPIHPGHDSNIALELTHADGDVEGAFDDAAHVVSCALSFNRHTGTPLEPRAILARHEPADGAMTIHMSHQCPHQMQAEYARLLGLEMHRMRVICPDVGGAFGIKQQLYGDELAVCAAAKHLGRSVRFLADRAESLLSDIQAREHEVTARMALNADGTIRGITVDDVFGIGAYHQHPRSSMGEPRALMTLTGAPYRVPAFAARARIVFQTKVQSGHYRGVGHPLACTVTERLMDKAAAALALSPEEIRARNFVTSADMPYRSAAGTVFRRLAFTESLAALRQGIDLPALRDSIAMRRADGEVVGLGLAAFVEQTSRGPAFYGEGGQAVTSRDGAVVLLEPSGAIRVQSSITEQGQGSEWGIRQLVAATFALSPDAVEMITGDTATTPHGGGTWGSRGMAIAGEAAHRASLRLHKEILSLAAHLLGVDRAGLSMSNGAILRDGQPAGLGLRDVAEAAHFRPYSFGGRQPQLVQTESWGPLEQPFRCGTGLQLSMVRIDEGTGQVMLERHVVVHEAGRVVNAMLVDGQIRGGVAQGLGAALAEHCRTTAAGQAVARSFATYRVPMAIDLPDIELIHAAGPRSSDEGLGIVGVGEAGTVGAGAAVLNAVNDALLATGGREIACFPLRPDLILPALWTR